MPGKKAILLKMAFKKLISISILNGFSMLQIQQQVLLEGDCQIQHGSCIAFGFDSIAFIGATPKNPASGLIA